MRDSSSTFFAGLLCGLVCTSLLLLPVVLVINDKWLIDQKYNYTSNVKLYEVGYGEMIVENGKIKFKLREPTAE